MLPPTREMATTLKFPRMALRIGVTGHRPPKLPAAKEPEIREAVRQVLQFIHATVEDIAARAAGYGSEKPIVRVVSPLAEGADRLVAQEGLNLGFQLQCPLPAFIEEYSRDFPVGESSDTFDQLLQQANAAFELDGHRAGAWLEPVAYEAVGRLTLAHSDLLIAVWDGHWGEQGGTSQMVREAQQSGICTVRIDPQDPLQIECFSPEAEIESEWREKLCRSMTEMLIPPQCAPGRVRQYLKEGFPGNGVDPISTQRDHADRIAGKFARRYRRAYKAIYSLAPMATACAVGGLWLAAMGRHIVPEWLSWIELFCIAVILLLILWDRYHAHWHDHWLDTRVLAEQFRAWECLAPIGQAPSVSRLPPYASPNAVQHDWTGWYLRARVREQGLLSAKLTPGYLEEYRQRLLQIVKDQKNHHLTKGHARKRTFKSMEFVTLILFVITAIACLVHLFLPHILKGEELFWLATLGGITAALPAFGAALEGLKAQGEYRRLAERAEGMQHRLDILQKTLEKFGSEAPGFATLTRIAHETSAVMLDELSDWRNLVRDKDLHL